MRIETGAEIESLLADVTLKWLVAVQFTALVRLPHVGGEV